MWIQSALRTLSINKKVIFFNSAFVSIVLFAFTCTLFALFGATEQLLRQDKVLLAFERIHSLSDQFSDLEADRYDLDAAALQDPRQVEFVNNRIQQYADLVVSQRDKIASQVSPLLADFTKLNQQAVSSAQAGQLGQSQQLLARSHEIGREIRSQLQLAAVIAARQTNTHGAAVLKTHQYLIELLLIFIVLVVGFGIVSSLFLIRSIRMPLLRAISVADAISHGELDSDFSEVSNDEAGLLLQALARVQQNLQLSADKEQQFALKMLKLKAALDSISGNVMVLDKENKIIYFNRGMNEVLAYNENHVRELVPDFRLNKLLNHPISELLAGQDEFDSLSLKQLASHQEFSLVFGNNRFSCICDPIYDESNRRLGTVLLWIEKTKHLMIEQEVRDVVSAAGHGDLSKRIEQNGKQGFYHILGSSINQVLEITDLITRDTMAMFASLARGDLTTKIEHEYQGEFNKVKSDANYTIDKLTEIIDQILQSASTVSQGAGEIAQGSEVFGERIESQACALEETSRSMRNITDLVAKNTSSAADATVLSKNAMEQAVKGGQVIQRAINAMSKISSSSQQIAEIINVIDDIAFQTNLLALNASVEAARAGEQGRGFVVVATEVRELAQRCAEAAQEINSLISASVQQVADGFELVNTSGKALESIVQAAREANEITEHIAQSSVEQSEKISEVNRAVAMMNTLIQQNVGLIEEAAASSKMLEGESQVLVSLMSFFSLKKTIGQVEV